MFFLYFCKNIIECISHFCRLHKFFKATHKIALNKRINKQNQHFTKYFLTIFASFKIEFNKGNI